MEDSQLSEDRKTHKQYTCKLDFFFLYKPVSNKSLLCYFYDVFQKQHWAYLEKVTWACPAPFQSGTCQGLLVLPVCSLTAEQLKSPLCHSWQRPNPFLACWELPYSSALTRPGGSWSPPANGHGADQILIEDPESLGLWYHTHTGLPQQPGIQFSSPPCTSQIFFESM